VANVGDHRAGVTQPLLPAGLVGVGAGPGDVVAGAGALTAGLHRWIVVGPIKPSVLAGQPEAALAERVEAERLSEQWRRRCGRAAVGAGALGADQRMLGGHLRMDGAQR